MRARNPLALFGLTACIAACSAPPRAGGALAPHDHADLPAPPAPPRAAGAAPTFVEDDYAKALASARAKGVPLFIDAWAPWCHTCVSLRAYVLHDPRLGSVTDRFEWLAVDTERAQNGAVLAKFPVEELPTLYVVDAKSEAPLLKWRGSLTAPELVALLMGIGHGGAAPFEIAAKSGDEAAARGDAGAARADYEAALANAPRDWADRPRVADSLVALLAHQKDLAACVRLARGEPLPLGTATLDLLVSGLDCATLLPDRAERIAGVNDLAARVEAALSSPTADALLIDDRSGAYETLVDAYHSMGRADDARRVATRWSVLLDDAAAKATDASHRAVFDSHRLLAYIELGEAAKAIPMLEASERDLPSDYNPPARLGRAFTELGRLDEARAALGRALGRAYGPRKLKIFAAAADVDAKRHDVRGERRTLEAAMEYARSIDLTGGYVKLREELEKRLEGIGGKR